MQMIGEDNNSIQRQGMIVARLAECVAQISDVPHQEVGATPGGQIDREKIPPASKADTRVGPHSHKVAGIRRCLIPAYGPTALSKP